MAANITPTKNNPPEMETTPKRSIRISNRSPRTPKCCPGCSEHNTPPQAKRNLMPNLVERKKSIKPTVFYKPNKKYVNPFDRMITGKTKVTLPAPASPKKKRHKTTNIGTKKKGVKVVSKKVKPTVAPKKKRGDVKKKPKVVKVVPINRSIKAYLSLKKLKALKESSKSPKKISPIKLVNKIRSPTKLKKLSPLKSPKKTRSNSKLPKEMSPKKTPNKSTKMSPKKTPNKSTKMSPKETPNKSTKMPPKKSPNKSMKISPKKSIKTTKSVQISKSPKKKLGQTSRAKKTPKASPQKIIRSPRKILEKNPKYLGKGVSSKKQLPGSPDKTAEANTPIKSSISPTKLLGENTLHVRSATPKKLIGASPRKKPMVDSPKSQRKGISLSSPKKTTDSPRKLRDSPKKIDGVTLQRNSPAKSLSKRTKTVAPRKFFKSGPKSPNKGKIEVKKWVAALTKKGAKTVKAKTRRLVSKPKSPKKTRKRKSELTSNVSNKKRKTIALIEKENIQNKDFVSEQAELANDVPLKESNSPRRENISSDFPSTVKLAAKETPPEIVIENDPNDSVDALVLLKENNIPEIEADVQINEAPKAAKLFPIFTKTAKIKSPSPKKNDPISPTKQRLKSLKKFSSKKSPGLKQTIIDAGQKEIGGKVCQTCNMVFTIGELEDEALHARYHNNFVQRLRFIGWKSERIIGEFSDGRMIIVGPEDQNYKLKKLEEIRAFVDECLGYPSVAIPDETSVYILYIAKQKIVGCLIAQQIKLAYRVLPPKENQPEMSYETMLCSTDAVPALCGVSRIWTAPKFRRKKIATRMLDSLRCNFIYGHNLAINDIAFSDPSPAGRMFAANYMKCNTFLVYK